MSQTIKLPDNCIGDFVQFVTSKPSIIFTAASIPVISIYAVYKYWYTQSQNAQYDKFKNTPKDEVILHAAQQIDYPSGITTCQPWVHKIELFCKMAKIPYVRDHSCPFGPNGKSPWITFNGLHKSDSQLIIELLEKKFEFPHQGSYNEEELAIARAVRVMLEERFFWAIPVYRFVWEEGKSTFYRYWACLELPWYIPLWLIKRKFKKIYEEQAIAHGIGRHSKEDMLEMFSGDLRTVSKILGNKKYILGDTPCVDDCSIFGFLAQAAYGMPESPFEKLVNEELPNLKNYVDRIREEYFPEWNN